MGKEKNFEMASLALALLALICSLAFGMIPLLFGILASRSASLALAGSKGLQSHPKARLGASAAVGALAFLMFAGLASWGFQGVGEAVKNSPAMAARLAEQLGSYKSALPPSMAAKLPDGSEKLLQAAADFASFQLPSIAAMGRSWAGGFLLSVVGWIIGLLMANAPASGSSSSAPLAKAIRRRAALISELFEKIVVAQFFVACANTAFAALYMFILLPLAGYEMPYAAGLVLLTLILSMVPAAGNVVCNAIVALVALGVGPGLAAASLCYLIAVHKLEYFVNAKIVGPKVDTSVWELLLAMFFLEAIFGVAGIVAAPLFYACCKAELKALGWV